MTAQLILSLSSGPVATAQIQAVNLDTWHIAERRPAIAMWLEGREEPMYFLHESADGCRIIAWAEMMQRRHKFLSTERFVFALAQVVAAKWHGDALEVHVEGRALPFMIPVDIEISVAVALWASRQDDDDKDTTEPRAVAIAS